MVPGNSKDPPNPVAARTKAPKQHPVITTMAVPGFMFWQLEECQQKAPENSTQGKSRQKPILPGEVEEKSNYFEQQHRSGKHLFFLGGGSRVSSITA